MQRFSRPPRKIFVIGTGSYFGPKQPPGRLGHSEQTDVLHQLRPVLFSLRILGLYSGRREEYGKRPSPWFDHVSPWTCVVLGLLCTYVTASLASCMNGQFWAAAFPFLKTGCALVSSQAVIRKEADVCHLAWRLSEFPSACTVTLRTTATVMATSVWAFVALRIIFQCMVLLAFTPQELSEHAASAWFGIDGQLPRELLLPLSMLDRALDSILVDASLFSSMALYLSLAVALRHRYVAFNAVIERHALRRTPLESGELKQLMLAHTELGSAVRHLDAGFAPTVFCWVALFVMGVCVEVSRFLGHRRLGDRFEVVILALNLGSVTLAFLLLSVLASRLTEAAHASSVPLHRCLGHHPAKNRQALASGLGRGSTAERSSEGSAFAEHAPKPPALLEGRLLVSQLRAPEVVLTGWGFFAFSRGFVLTLAGALISYVVIILQLNPATSPGGSNDSAPDH